MRCIAVLSALPDIVFFDCDSEYAAQLKEFAAQQGLSQRGNKPNLDALHMQLLPIFASLDMTEVGEMPVRSFTTAGGHHFVIRRFDEFLYVGMSNEDSMEFVAGQLLLLRQLVNMLYGPVTLALKEGSVRHREQTWKSTSTLIRTVQEQRNKEQSYLVQSIELIRVNQHVRRICYDALEYALSKEGPRGWGSHAMLMVSNKLLVMYSRPNAQKLNSSDVFLLSLFIQYLVDRSPTLDTSGPDLNVSMPDLTLRRSSSANMSVETFFPAREQLSPIAAIPDPDKQSSDDPPFQSPAATPGTSRPGSPPLPRLPDLEGLDANPDLAEEMHDAVVGDLPDIDAPPIRVGSPPSDAFQEARSNYGSSYDADQSVDHQDTQFDSCEEGTAPAAADAERGLVRQLVGEEAEVEQKMELRRQLVYLHTASNNYAPHIMHCCEVAPSIALIVLSEGKNIPLSDLLHSSLNVLQKIRDMGDASQSRARASELAEEMSSRCYMAVRGAIGQRNSRTQINGNYFLVPAPTSGERPVFERSTKDAYLYRHDIVNAWCIGEELGDISNKSCSAMVTDDALSPENIEHVWEVYDHDLCTFHSDDKIRIRCVRGDGAIRNRDGNWATKSSNGLYYCGGSATCSCGACNGKCGPHDGCACFSCQALCETESAFLDTGSATAVRREAERALRESVEAERLLKKETENLAALSKRMLQVGGRGCLNRTQSDRIIGLAARLFDLARKENTKRRWQLVTDGAETMARYLRMNVGKVISRSNQTGDPEEEECVTGIQQYVATTLVDYTEFFHIKIHRNVTMSIYLKMFPGLVHFIYVDRTRDYIIAPCLSPSTEGTPVSAAERAQYPTLKERVWHMHAEALQRLSQGFTSMVAKAGDFQYSYLLWFEDTEGTRLRPEKELQPTDNPVGAQFYADLVEELFPGERAGSVFCYELYMVHLSVVPFELSMAHGHDLVSELRARS